MLYADFMAVGNGNRPTMMTGAAGLHPERLRLLAKVARMYHERGLRQEQIAEELHISQSRVSRLLRQAAATGIVRTVVTLPSGVHTEIEERLQAVYQLRDAVVVDADGASGDVIRALGAAAALYLEETLGKGEAIGISSWSSTLLAAADAMRPLPGGAVDIVVQLLGGIGEPTVQMQANRLIGRLCEATGARPLFMPTPGLVSAAAVRRAVTKDAAVSEVMAAWEHLTVALVGIGTLDPSPLLQGSGNAIPPGEREELRQLGAVGDVCLRFFNHAGQLVSSPLNDRVLGITPPAFMRIGRRIGVAGGPAKCPAIRAALLGGWVNILVTDLDTARHLVANSESAPSAD
jgi:DNA-binding transcriptional regulator LsrR (DeoR family)